MTVPAFWRTGPVSPAAPLEAPVSPSFTFALIRSGAGTPDPFTGR